MDRVERVLAALDGKTPDWPPFSIWFHFGSQHLPPATTAELHLRFYRAYDLDWIKVMSDYRYPMPPGMVEVSSADDLARFGRFGMDAEPLARQLDVLRTLSRELRGEAPFIETVFSPFGVARRTLRSRLREFQQQRPDLFKAFLESITETLRDYVAAVAETGASGIFYSVNGLSTEELSDPEFEQWALPYDLAVLEAVWEQVRAGRFYFTVAHLHGLKLRYRVAFERFPCHAFNWSDRLTPPSLAEARRLTGRALLGGIRETGTSRRTPSEMAAEVRSAIEEAGPAGLLIGPGCAVETQIPADLIHAAREACRQG